MFTIFFYGQYIKNLMFLWKMFAFNLYELFLEALYNIVFISFFYTKINCLDKLLYVRGVKIDKKISSYSPGANSVYLGFLPFCVCLAMVVNGLYKHSRRLRQNTADSRRFGSLRTDWPGRIRSPNWFRTCPSRQTLKVFGRRPNGGDMSTDKGAKPLPRCVSKLVGFVRVTLTSNTVDERCRQKGRRCVGWPVVLLITVSGTTCPSRIMYRMFPDGRDSVLCAKYV